MFLSSFSISHSAVYGCQLSPDASLGPRSFVRDSRLAPHSALPTFIQPFRPSFSPSDLHSALPALIQPSGLFGAMPAYARHPHQFRHPAIRLGTLIIINSK